MKITSALKTFKELDQRGIYIFKRRDLEKLFSDENEKTLQKSLQRLVKAGVLERVCKGIYINALVADRKPHIVEELACALRSGYLSYISLETMLSQYGDISQIPISVITLMTTGRSGRYKTRFGTIEFTHTERSFKDLLESTILVPDRPLRIATRAAARRDLMRVGRNVNMLEPTEDDE